MGHSQNEKALTRERILGVASRRLRETGLDGLSIADLMEEAGLTPGGFYKHFASREDLLANALDQAMTETLERPAPSLGALIDKYLSVEHRDATGSGCAISALAADVARSDSGCRAVFTEQLRASLSRISVLADAAGADDSAQAAMFRISALVGALVLARAVDDPQMSEALMKAGRSNLNPSSRPRAKRERPGLSSSRGGRRSRPTQLDNGETQ